MIKPKTIKDAQFLASKKEGKCLSEIYKNNATHLLWECKLKHQWWTTYGHVQRGYWCPECAGNKRKTIEQCINVAKNKNGQCLSKNYINDNTNLLWRCNFGHEWLATYDNVSRGKWCPTCCGKKRKTLEDCKKLAESKNGKCLSVEYIDSYKKLLWECELGHQWKANYGHVCFETWCPICAKSKSQKQLFEIIKRFFPENEVCYNFREFKWMTTKKRKQEIDIFIKEQKLAIEYDGRQHFEPIKFWGAEEAFSHTQYCDQNKNKLISEHPDDVKCFIRIPYWEPITEENIRRILKERGVEI